MGFSKLFIKLKNDFPIEVLFIMISIDNIVTLWQSLLLEKKIFLISNSKIALTKVCMALSSLLFPINWIHVFIPVLPEKLQLFSDAPVPLIIGICYEFELKDVPDDIIVFDIDKNVFLKFKEKLPEEPQQITEMKQKLQKYNRKFNNPRDKIKISHIDSLFKNRVDYTDKEKVIIDVNAIRDIFFKFFLNAFKNYQEFVSCFGKIATNSLSNTATGKEVTFDKEIFLSENQAKGGSFFDHFSETTLLSVFMDSFMDIGKNKSLEFFLEYLICLFIVLLKMKN